MKPEEVASNWFHGNKEVSITQFARLSLDEQRQVLDDLGCTDVDDEVLSMIVTAYHVGERSGVKAAAAYIESFEGKHRVVGRLKCDGCEGYFPPHSLLEFAGNVTAVGGGGFIGNCLADVQFSKSDLGMIWANATSPALREAMSSIPLDEVTTLPVVVRRLRYCQDCTHQILDGAFKFMAREES